MEDVIKWIAIILITSLMLGVVFALFETFLHRKNGEFYFHAEEAYIFLHGEKKYIFKKKCPRDFFHVFYHYFLYNFIWFLIQPF